MAAVFAAAPAVAQDFTGTTVTISGTATVAETDSDQTLTYTITRTGAEFTQTANSLISFVDANSVDISKTGTATSLGVSPSVFTATSADYSLVGNNLISFAPGEDSKQFSITIAGDDLSEEDESFAISISFSNIGDSFLVTITDDDAVRTLTVTGPASIDEGAGGTFTVNLVGTAFTSPTAVTWTVTHGDTVAADFTAVTGRVNFGVGDTSQTFAITPADDDLDEDAESFTVQITVADEGADGGTTFGDAASSNIADNDMAGVVIAPAMLEAPEGGEAEYSVRLTAEPTATVTVAISSSADTVATPMPPTLTFTAANWRAGETVTVTAADTAEVDDTATLTHTVTGSGEYASVTAGDVTVTIVAQATAQATHELLLPEVTRAVVGEMFGAVAERVGGVGGQIDGGHGGAGFSLNGQSNWYDIVANQVNLLAAGNGVDGGIDIRDIDAKQLLRGLRFASPVSAGASHGEHGYGHANLAFWGGGDYRDFGGEDGDDDWDGTVFSMRFGVDGQVRRNLRAGLMLSYSDSDTEYSRVANGNTTKGDYESNLTSVAPYLRWNLGADHAWASVSYGSGEVEVKPAGGDASTNDVTMTGAAFGGGRKLLEQDGRELSLRADAFVAESEVDGDGDSTVAGVDDDIDVDANRLRVALAWSYPGRFAAGLLSPAFDLGVRHDGGDGRTGTGLELGGALRYRSADAGITAEANARALLGHSGDHRGWGVGGLLRVQNGADGQGLAVTVAPGYGDFGGDSATGSGHAGDSRLWRNGMVAGKTIAEPVARLDAEVGYGMPMSLAGDSSLGRAFGFDAGEFGDGMLTPYSALRFGDTNRDYRLGLRWHANRLALDVFASHAIDNTIAIEGRLRF